MTSVMLDKNEQRVQILAEKLRYLFTLPTWNTFPVLRSLISDDWLWGKNWRSEQFCTVSGFRQTSVKNAQKKSWRILWLWKIYGSETDDCYPVRQKLWVDSLVTEEIQWQYSWASNQTVFLSSAVFLLLYHLYFSQPGNNGNPAAATTQLSIKSNCCRSNCTLLSGHLVMKQLLGFREIMTFLSCITCELTSQYSSISTLRSIRGQRKGHGKDLGSHFRTSSCFVELYQVPFNYVMSGHIKEFWQILFWLMRLFTEDS